MKPYESNFRLSFVLLFLTIFTQTMIFFSLLGMQFYPFSTMCALGAWLFMRRAIEALKEEFREIEELI